MIYVLKTNFYPKITSALLAGALGVFEKQNKAYEIIEMAGVGELPIVAKTILESNKNVEGILCLGVIIKGETDHYEWLITQTERGLSRLTLDFNTPIIQGVIPADSLEIVKRRTDRGAEWAETLCQTIEMIEDIKKD